MVTLPFTATISANVFPSLVQVKQEEQRILCFKSPEVLIHAVSVRPISMESFTVPVSKM
jgi:hypothetical protein